MKSKLLSILVITTFLCGCQSSEKIVFEPTVESLRQYETPEWFKDAKFGIYCHWNAQSASKSRNSGWYARHMYEEGHSSYNDHLKNWGHPSEVGYKNIIEAWNPDKFDAARWISLFNDAGAKYVMTMAVHHDNFDFWDSKYQPKWNSLNYGPKVDVCGEMKRECEKVGIRWGVRTHLGRTYSWFQTNKGADLKGLKKGVPYDGNNPDFEDLYLKKATKEQIGENYNQIRHPLQPSEEWVKHWKNRMFDLIDNYHPDHFYFDGAIPFMNDGGKAGMEVIAHYYNHNAARHSGKNEGVMVIKDIKDHGFYYNKVSSVVLERKRENDIVYPTRETENSTGPWFYTGDETGYRSSKSLMHEMIDVVSKNCNFVLNVPPRPNGTFDDSSLKILKDFGVWLRQNGEAIYTSRPWKTFGEGDIRFTTNGKIMYAIYLNKPTRYKVIQSLKSWNSDVINSVQLIGSNKKINWKLTEKGLDIDFPENSVEQLAYVYKISCTELLSELPFSAIDLNSVEEENANNREKYGADGNGTVTLPKNIKN